MDINKMINEEEDRKKILEENYQKESGKLKSFYKTAIIITVVVMLTVNAVGAIVGFLYAKKWLNHEIEAVSSRLETAFQDKLTADLKREITDDVLKKYAREHYLPEDYSSIGLFVGSLRRSSVVEIYSGNGTTDIVTASGMIINNEGYVITNSHVVNFETVVDSGSGTSTKIYTPYENVRGIVYNDNNRYEMQIVAYDTVKDIALLRFVNIPANAHGTVFGSADFVVPGEDAVVIGNTLGWGVSVTTGVVSGISSYNELTVLQTDALTLQGSSGGGMFNVFGELIGMVSFKISSSSGDSTGFAISADDIISYIELVNTTLHLNVTYTFSDNLPK